MTAELETHPCGRPIVLVQRGSKKSGLKQGDVRPCECLRCQGPLSRQTFWDDAGYRGYYRCSGTDGIPGCGLMRQCAGATIDAMICRDCLGIPPAPAPKAAAPVKRGKAA